MNLADSNPRKQQKAEEWFCLCWNYLRHRKLNPASKPRCERCGMERPC